MPYADKEEQRAHDKRYYLENKERLSVLAGMRHKIFREKYPDKVKESNRRCQQAVRKKVLLYYSRGKLVCACCGDNRYCFLTIDHIIPIRKRNQTGSSLHYMLVRNNFPSGYQVLCMNCNKLKRDYEKCPCNTLVSESERPNWGFIKIDGG